MFSERSSSKFMVDNNGTLGCDFRGETLSSYYSRDRENSLNRERVQIGRL